MKTGSTQTAFRNAMATSLRNFRKMRRLSQENMADACGVSRGAYRAWETARNLPSMDNLRMALEVLGVSLSAFFTSVERHEGWNAGRPEPEQGYRYPAERTR